MADHAPTPWFVHETKHPHHLGGEHTERRIFTVAIHPQLKDHDGVVNGSVGVGLVEGGLPTHMVSISAEDAAFIVKAVNAHEALEAVRKAAYDYFMCAVQDEADDLECCISEKQHELAKTLRDALRDGAVGGAHD